MQVKSIATNTASGMHDMLSATPIASSPQRDTYAAEAKSLHVALLNNLARKYTKYIANKQSSKSPRMCFHSDTYEATELAACDRDDHGGLFRKKYSIVILR